MCPWVCSLPDLIGGQGVYLVSEYHLYSCLRVHYLLLSFPVHVSFVCRQHFLKVRVSVPSSFQFVLTLLPCFCLFPTFSWNLFHHFQIRCLISSSLVFFFVILVSFHSSSSFVIWFTIHLFFIRGSFSRSLPGIFSSGIICIRHPFYIFFFLDFKCCVLLVHNVLYLITTSFKLVFLVFSYGLSKPLTFLLLFITHPSLSSINHLITTRFWFSNHILLSHSRFVFVLRHSCNLFFFQDCFF
jgi:hypothetical protein